MPTVANERLEQLPGDEQLALVIQQQKIIAHLANRNRRSQSGGGKIPLVDCDLAKFFAEAILSLTAIRYFFLVGTLCCCH
jgi:hypothetical protein